MGKHDTQDKAYDFFLDRARSQVPFTKVDLQTAVGWSPASVNTYVSKHCRQFLVRHDRGANLAFTVRPYFARITRSEFLEHVTQVKSLFTTYSRSVYEAVVSYEFLLPLTREDKLKRGLDDLFFSDRIAARLREVGTEALGDVLPRQFEENDDEYFGRATRVAGDLFGGYSISHVSGRFRQGELASRGEVGGPQVEKPPYLVDETTAVVRFIIPCPSTKRDHGGGFDLKRIPVDNITEKDEQSALRHDIRLIRAVFVQMFVEALVPAIRGEALIWVLETTPFGTRLLSLEQAIESGADQADDEDD